MGDGSMEMEGGQPKTEVNVGGGAFELAISALLDPIILFSPSSRAEMSCVMGGNALSLAMKAKFVK